MAADQEELLKKPASRFWDHRLRPIEADSLDEALRILAERVEAEGPQDEFSEEPTVWELPADE